MTCRKCIGRATPTGPHRAGDRPDAAGFRRRSVHRGEPTQRVGPGQMSRTSAAHRGRRGRQFTHRRPGNHDGLQARDRWQCVPAGERPDRRQHTGGHHQRIEPAQRLAGGGLGLHDLAWGATDPISLTTPDDPRRYPEKTQAQAVSGQGAADINPATSPAQRRTNLENPWHCSSVSLAPKSMPKRAPLAMAFSAAWSCLSPIFSGAN